MIVDIEDLLESATRYSKEKTAYETELDSVQYGYMVSTDGIDCVAKQFELQSDAYLMARLRT